MKWSLLLVLLVVLPIAFAVSAYVARKPIAAFLVQSYLQRHGVASAVEFDRLARGGFSARVRLGPATPEFTAEIFDVTLDYTGPFAFPTIGTVRFVRPVLRATYDGKRLYLGSLQQLVDEALAKPPQEPGPSVSIEDGRVFVSTPYGSLQFGVEAKIDHGRLTLLNSHLEPAILRGPGGAADIAGGTVTARTVMSAIDARVALKINAAKFDTVFESHGIDASADLRGIAWVRGNATDFSVAAAALRIISETMTAARFSAAQSQSDLAVQNLHGTYRNGQSDLSFPAASLRITSDTVTGAGFSVAQSNADLAVQNLHGTYRDGQSDFSFPTASLRIASKAVSGGQISAAQSDSGLALQNLQGSYRNGQIRAAARADLTTDLTSLKAEMGSAEKISARASLEHAILNVFENASTVEGAVQLTFDGTNARYRLKAGDVAVRAIQGAFAGTGSLGNTRADGRLEGSLTARANVPRRVALELVRDVPAIGTDPPLSAVLADALGDVNLRFPKLVVTRSDTDMSLAIPVPVSATAAKGVKFTLSPQGARPLLHRIATATDGAFGLEISGGALPELKLLVSTYRMRDEAGGVAFTAATEFDAKLSLPSFKDIHLSGSGELDRRNGRLTFASTRCTDIDIGAALGRGSALMINAKGRLCAEPMRPVLIADTSGWRIAGTWTGASAQFPLAQSAVAAGEGRVELAGDAAGARSGRVVVTRALLSDSQPQARFLPINVSGDLDLAGTEWRGVLGLATHNRRVATASVTHQTQTGAGSASIEAKNLSFEPGMFQPADISPLLAPLGTRIAGHADFTGLVSWNDKGIQSNGRLHVMSVNLQSRYGAVRGVNGDLALSSLLPVVLAPSQTIAVDRIDWLVPVEQAKVQFTILPTEIALESATANVAAGRVSLDPETIPFTPGATTQGTLHLQNVDLTPLLFSAGLGGRVEVAARIGGAIPFTYGPQGLRFANGKIAAEGPGRLSIQRQALIAAAGVGEGTQPPPSAVQDFAYQALENLSFDQLNGDVNSLPMGRLGVLLHVKGRHDPAQAMETRIGILDLLRGHAFEKPLPLPKGTPIDLTLDTSLNLDELLASYFGSGGGAMMPPR